MFVGQRGVFFKENNEFADQLTLIICGLRGCSEWGVERGWGRLESGRLSECLPLHN